MRDYEGRPGADEYAPYYQPYVALVAEGGIVGILARGWCGLSSGLWWRF